MTTRVFVKQYATMERLAAAVRHHQWLTRYTPPLRLPALLDADPATRTLHMEHVPAARPFAQADLHQAARDIGLLHAQILTDEPSLRLSAAHHGPGGHVLADFFTPRRSALLGRLQANEAPDAWITMHQVDQVLAVATGSPACIYKDTNIRNLLPTVDGLVTVDFDDLTLAPPGFDLAKLVCSWVMTHGFLAADTIEAVLHRYNAAMPGASSCPLSVFFVWLEVHHVLTAAYVGRGGYRHLWTTMRPPEAAQLYADGIAVTPKRHPCH